MGLSASAMDRRAENNANDKHDARSQAAVDAGGHPVDVGPLLAIPDQFVVDRRGRAGLLAA